MTPARVEWLAGAALAVLAGLLLFQDLGSASFHDGDEALYATVTAEMIEAGSPLTPLYWGAPFLHKPPLPYWLMAAARMWVPGPEEFVFRLPSALSALVLLGMVYMTARWLAGAVAAWLATAWLMLNHQFLFEHVARTANFDAMATMLSFGALVAGLRSTESWRWWLAAAVFTGALGLVKAPLIVFVAAPVLMFHVRRGSGVRRYMSAVGLGAVILAGPWHLHQWWRHGSAFVDTYVMYEVVGRFGTTLRNPYGHRFVHLQAAWSSFLPWSPLLVALLVVGLRATRFQPHDTKRLVTQALAAYACAFLVVLCFVSAKWPWYPVPAYPALAVVGAVVLVRAAADDRWPLWALWSAAIIAVSVACLHINTGYDPVVRVSSRWPALDPFLTFAWPATAWRLWGLLGIGLLAAVAVFVARSPMAHRRTATAALALAMVAAGVTTLAAVRSVPRLYVGPVHRLASLLTAARVERVYALGFDHLPQYAGRQEPISSYYLTGMVGAEVIDCRTAIDCVDRASTSRDVIVIGPEMAAAATVLAIQEHAPLAQIWVRRPGRSLRDTTFERAAAPAP